jgi:hypothetical protein
VGEFNLPFSPKREMRVGGVVPSYGDSHLDRGWLWLLDWYTGIENNSATRAGFVISLLQS